MNGIHDVGGMDGFGTIKREENEPVFHQPWEGRMRAIHTLIKKKHGIYNTDEGRYAVERMNPVYYLGSTYYQIWLLRMEELLIEKGVLKKDNLDEKTNQLSLQPFTPHLESYRNLIPQIRSTQRSVFLPTQRTYQADEPIEPKYSVGTVVVVKEMSLLGHTRVPRYVRGKQGVIEKNHGNFHVPDIKAHKGIDVYQPVYLVRFNAQDLWGADAAKKDKVYIEMWEDYLELGGVSNGKSR